MVVRYEARPTGATAEFDPEHYTSGINARDAIVGSKKNENYFDVEDHSVGRDHAGPPMRYIIKSRSFVISCKG